MSSCIYSTYSTVGVVDTEATSNMEIWWDWKSLVKQHPPKKTSLKSCPKSFKDSLSKTPAAVDSCMYLKKKTLGVKMDGRFHPVFFFVLDPGVYHTYFFNSWLNYAHKVIMSFIERSPETPIKQGVEMSSI